MDSFKKPNQEGKEVEGRRETRSTSRPSLAEDLVARSPRVVLERIASPQEKELSCHSRDSSVGRSDRKRPRRDASEDRMSVGAYAASDCESEVSIASSTRSRGGVTHGRYVGLHRQREEYRRLAAESAQSSDTLDEKAEEERRRRDARAEVRDLISSGLKPMDPSSAKEAIDGSLMAILEVARTSKNIKGCLIKRLKDAVEEIQGGVRALTKSTGTEGLLAENARLSRELEELRGKIQSVEKRTAPAALDFEAMQRAIMVSVGTMMDAKLAGLSSRLPPEPILRPPLAADGRRAEAEATGRGPKPAYSHVLRAAPAPKPAPKTAPKAAPKPAPRPVPRLAPKTAPGPAPTPVPKPAPRLVPKPTPTPDPKPAKGKAKTVVQPAPALVPAPEEAPVASTSEAVDEGWTTVSKKKKGPKPKAPERPKAQPAKKGKAPPQKKKGGPKAVSGKQRRKRAQRQRRLARTAAVVLTITPEAEKEGLTYATVLTKARAGVDLNAMGVDMAADPIRIRKAQTGARVLQLPKNVGQEAADEMAKKLEAIYGGDVRVTRPVRCAELRVSNLDDSVTKDEVRDVAARQSQCAPDRIKVGDLRPSPGQKFSTVLKCPLEAVPRLVTTRTQKFLVGWSSATVVQLEARPLKCYRCLALGHTRPVCMCPADRSGLCYRCAMPGHKAAVCKEPARCAICAELGRGAAHQMGSRGCAPPALIRKQMAALGKVPNAATSSRAQPCEEERMDDQ
ncbi:actin cytoskeleton-regulatory complex protein PAN1-like [Trichoplusia ni]|uniref:Actin cytoskeleton-regulatory complex protein PAN1-like n=1 Tax=Trichoplusia ni TaxID=7111 RepID=A0A7E5X3L7_TRINI|nr:actin cytoskeleton-regulatory complex protein PAN1-like [Trichoplusia ni]